MCHALEFNFRYCGTLVSVPWYIIVRLIEHSVGLGSTRSTIESQGATDLQDPTMQLRTHASFTKWWKNLDPADIVSYSPLRPQLRVSADGQQLEFVPETISMDPPLGEQQLQKWVALQQKGCSDKAAAGSSGSSSSETYNSTPAPAPHCINQQQGVWDVRRFISLLLGEIPRLRDDATGYGPQGKGFIDHVDIPAEVEEAHGWLTERYPQLLRL